MNEEDHHEAEDEREELSIELDLDEPSDWRSIATAFAGLATRDADAEPNRRRDHRVDTSFGASTTFVDAVRDPVTHEMCYTTSEEDSVLNVSRRGAGLRCVQPPEIGSRVLLEIHPPSETRPIEVMGRACWTRVEYVPGRHGARAVAAVGIEFLGGSSRALDRYESWLAELASATETSVAAPPALG